MRDPAAAACDPVGRCITCSDEAVPMRVVAAGSGALARCEGGAEIDATLVWPVAAGDEVLVHAGVALAHLSPVGAEEAAR